MSDLVNDYSLRRKRNLQLHHCYPDEQDEEEHEVETMKIESQRSAGGVHAGAASEDLTAGQGLWQYWRSHIDGEDALAHATHAFSKKMAKIFNIGDKKIRKQQALKHLIRGGIPPELRGRVGMLRVELLI